MNSLAAMALVIYCIVLSLIPLSNLHIEGFLLSDAKLLTDRVFNETDFMVLVHEVLFAHLCNVTDHLCRPVDRICDPPLDQVTLKLFQDVMALKPCLLSLALLASAYYAVRRYSITRGKTLPQTIFCYRLFDHSPPALNSL